MDFTVLKQNLTRLGYKVSCFDNVSQANAYLSGEIRNTTVAIGGSMTVSEMGLYEILSQNNDVLWHSRTTPQRSASEILELAKNTDIYISSANAVALTGEIINIDGRSNRVSSILFGHKKVYLVLGKNKIAKDYDSALWRARNIAAPLNAKRLNKNTPCAQSADRCYSCKSPERICRSLSVLWTKPPSAEFEIVLIDEDLGY